MTPTPLYYDLVRSGAVEKATRLYEENVKRGKQQSAPKPKRNPSKGEKRIQSGRSALFVGAMDLGPLRELFLGQSKRFTLVADSTAERVAGKSGCLWHPTFLES